MSEHPTRGTDATHEPTDKATMTDTPSTTQDAALTRQDGQVAQALRPSPARTGTPCCV